MAESQTLIGKPNAEANGEEKTSRKTLFFVAHGRTVQLDGETYKAGDSFRAKKSDVEHLIEAGFLQTQESGDELSGSVKTGDVVISGGQEQIAVKRVA